MFHLPPLGVCACFSQALSAVRSSRVNAHAPANILDGQSRLSVALSFVTDRPSSSAPIKITHNFGVRNATLQQMAGKLLPRTKKRRGCCVNQRLAFNGCQETQPRGIYE
ncbi:MULTISPECIES: hypothetical protein [Pseudomonas]|uniref:hypothetical protein n=1 Tax=Pseudomonas TaxID=286 RepID=UPI001591C1DB|nr:hypothetical protein [Pseudomonas sp. FP597]WLI06470.1 hypothetical protein PSH66_28510 [Pseudomonas sp. FP597]